MNVLCCVRLEDSGKFLFKIDDNMRINYEPW